MNHEALDGEGESLINWQSLDGISPTRLVLMGYEALSRNDFGRARLCFENAVDKSIQRSEALRQAALELGRLHEDGLGTEENSSIAFAYYRLAAEAGQLDAVQKVSDMYSKGQGTLKNKKHANYWSNIAREKSRAKGH
ncbi:MAG: hypothetical protein K2Y32_01355 [Candidatus Obscuribacterales bacterium]|nr:hypothetical protein [Candidatus Obscuribacterales bacterium]